MLHLKLNVTSSLPIDFTGIRPDTLERQSLQEIAELPVGQGNRTIPLESLFEISGDPSSMQWEISGDVSNVHRLGACMKQGDIVVHGNVGRHVGCNMLGGRIQIVGDAGDWLGAEMLGGQIRVAGNVANYLGANYPGSKFGMNGGEILIEGNAGHEAGRAMRRGLIAVAGNAGELTGYSMQAGTICIYGNCGPRVGAGMRRGTICVLGPSPQTLSPTFRHACSADPVALRIVQRHLRALGFLETSQSNTITNRNTNQNANPVTSPSYQLYNGDFLEGGRGEIYLAGPIFTT